MRLLTLLADLALPPRGSEVLVRDATPALLMQELSPICIGEGAHGCISLFPYTRPLVEACIIEAKFHGNVRAAELLAHSVREFLLEFLAEAAPFEVEPPVIVPMPLSPARYAERGYNQVERVVAKALAGSASLRMELGPTLLTRTRETKPQTSLQGRERRSNVFGAFELTSPCDPYRTYIVVDDVITTGNTMLAACEAMQAGGALRLLPLTLAY